MLDREEIDFYQIRIFASNSINFNPNAVVSANSILYVNITVNDVNDNPPQFDYLRYSVGISENDVVEKVLITFHANDPDLNDKVTYHILSETLTVSSDSLNNVKDSAFILNPESGNLILNFQVQQSMTGHFSFQVQARDLVNHTHEASVKIYVIAERHRIIFVFDNTISEVRGVNQQELLQIFTDAYDAECIHDDTLPHQLEDGNVDETLTNYRVHFIRNEEALEKEEIYG